MARGRADAGCGWLPPGRPQVAPTRWAHLPPSDARRAPGKGLRASSSQVRAAGTILQSALGALLQGECVWQRGPMRLAAFPCCSHNVAIGEWRKAHATGEGAR